MEIKSHIISRLSGRKLSVIYHDIDSADELEGRKVSGVHAYCFYGEKLVIVYAENKKRWTPAGGGVEEGESFEQAVIREVREETNMKVLSQRLIGFQDVFEPEKVVTQTRSVCIVEPYGDFVSDPDGDITEIKLIDTRDYKKYFDWGVVGDHIMERALGIINVQK